MRSKVRQSLLAAACVIALGPLSEAHAAVITAHGDIVVPGFSTGLFTQGTPAQNNDNTVAASPNTVGNQTFFNAGGFGNLDIEFITAESAGTTEYQIINLPFMVNNTGVAWAGFRFELGFGTGDAFVRSTALDGLTFDLEASPFSTAFPTFTADSDTVTWSGGLVPSVGVLVFSGISFDLPDGLAAYNPYGEHRFTLRQTPLAADPAAVPEPASMVLLGSGLVGLATRLRKRRAQ